MRELKNGTKIIGVDHGYGNIKTANTIMPTGITAYSTAPTFDGNILIYDGVYYRIGEGHKAFIADNNEKDDNSLYEILSDYISSGRVQVFDCRGKECVQVLIYSRFCEAGNYKWCGYFDCDEFFEMSVYKNIKEFLVPMEEYDCISFNWLLFGPNGNVFKQPGSIQERFPIPVSPVLYLKENVFIKSIVKGGEGRFPNCWFNGSHVPATTRGSEIKYSIGGYNEPYESNTIHAHYPPSYKFGYIKHYYTKSFEEWKNKASRGWPDATKTLDIGGYSLFNESYAVPVDNFLTGLFGDTHKTGREWQDALNSYSVIKLTNEGSFVYPFFMSVISIMSYARDHTFIFMDKHIDDAMYTIFLEYAFRTGNRACFARNEDEVWKTFLNFHNKGEDTYYIIGYS